MHMELAFALRMFDLLATHLANRGVSVSDLEARRQAAGGSLTLRDLDEIEQKAYQAVENIPE